MACPREDFGTISGGVSGVVRVAQLALWSYVLFRLQSTTASARSSPRAEFESHPISYDLRSRQLLYYFGFRGGEVEGNKEIIMEV